MKSIEIGKSAVVASQAALGVMRMDALDADAAAEVVRTAAEHGVNFFDTADIYGFNVNHDHASSRVLGRAWKDAGLKREDIFLQTKFGINIDFSDPNNVHATRYDFSAKHLITRLDEELEALGTDYVDFALLHRPDTLMEAEEIVEAFTTLHKAGKVRFVLAFRHRRHNALNIFIGKPVVLRDLHKLLRRIHEQNRVVRFALFQQHNVHRDCNI